MVAWNVAGSEVASHLSQLLGIPVKAGFLKREKIATEEAGYIALYRTDEGHLEGTCHLDIPLAAGVGSALSLLSPHLAMEAAKSSDFSPALVENSHEVLNVLAALKNGPGVPHVALRQLIRAEEAQEAERLAWMELPLEGSVEISLGAHGSGRMTLRARSGNRPPA